MSGQAPTIGLGPVQHYVPLADSLGADPLIASVNRACQGGGATSDYFTTINNMSQLFQQLRNNGRTGWSDGTDDTPIAAPIKYVAMDDLQGNSYYIKVAQSDVTQDADGNIATNGTTRTINGVTYNGIGTITMECGYSNYAFSRASWWVGTSIAGLVASSVVLPRLFSALKTVANVLADRLQATAESGKGAEGGEGEEDEEEGEDSAADSDIVAEEGGEVAIEEVAEEGAIALGDVFIGVGIALAIIFIVLSFVMHNSYHSVRLWNLTKYNLDWTIHFDTNEPEQQGQLVNGPVIFNSDNSIKSFGTIAGISNKSPVPGMKPQNSCHYADFNVNCSHEFSGIGYVLQYYLKDDDGKVQYTATMYFDIPFSGSNSTNCTMDPTVTDLQGYYDLNNGNNTNTLSSANSADNIITVTTTYDYLTGQHPVPNTPQGSASNEQYFYQSVINIQQNNLSSTGVTKQLKYRINKKQIRKSNIMQGLRPSLRKEVMKQLKPRLQKKLHAIR